MGSVQQPPKITFTAFQKHCRVNKTQVGTTIKITDFGNTAVHAGSNPGVRPLKAAGLCRASGVRYITRREQRASRFFLGGDSNNYK